MRRCAYCSTEFEPRTSRHRVCGAVKCKKAAQAEATKRHKEKPGYKDRHREQTRESRKRDPAGRLLSSVRNRQKDTSLTREWIQQRIDAGVCEVTGIPLDLSYPRMGVRSVATREALWVPSVDKIDPDGGYSPENCRVVCFAYNRAKSTATDADMIRLARGILNVGSD